MYCVKVTQSCLTLCDPMDCQGFSVHGILQARRLEWVAVPFSRASFQPRGQTQVSCRWILYRLSHQGTCTTYVFGIFIQCAHTFFFFFLLYLMACLVSPRSPFSLIILSTFWSSIYFRGTSQPIVMEKSVIKSNNPFPSESMHITDTTTPKALSNKFENKQPFTIFQREKETLHYVYRSNESCCFPVTQSWPTLCNPRECSTPGSSVPLDIHRLI